MANVCRRHLHFESDGTFKTVPALVRALNRCAGLRRKRHHAPSFVKSWRALPPLWKTSPITAGKNLRGVRRDGMSTPGGNMERTDRRLLPQCPVTALHDHDSLRVIQSVVFARSLGSARMRVGAHNARNTCPSWPLDREPHGRISCPFQGKTPARVQNMRVRMTRSLPDRNRRERCSYPSS
jgi:hypothetical protein